MPSVPGARGTTEQASRLRLALMRLSRRVRQEALGGEMTPSMLTALAVVDRLGPLTLGELATAEHVQPPTVTWIVDKLQEAGLVARELDVSDRRVIRVRVTDAGHRSAQRSRSRGNAYLARRLRALGDDDRAVLEAAIPVLERLLEDDR
jgi:DNA-binding MarR family transcriptional regulator